MLGRSLLCLALLAGTSALNFEQFVETPSTWREMRKALPDEPITLQIALNPRDVDVLKARLYAVSTPSSPEYRQFSSLEELTDLVAPPKSDVAKVMAWVRATLPEAEFVDATLNRDWVVVRTHVAGAERLLHTRFSMFENTAAASAVTKLHAVMSYTIPDAIVHAVGFVAGIHTFEFGMLTAGLSAKAPDAAAAYQSVTPAELDELYSLPKDKGTARLGSQAVVQFGDNFSPSDLQQFLGLYRSESVGDEVSVIGENKPEGRIQGEANLDTQYVMAVGSKIATTDYGLTLDADPAGMLQWAWMVGNDTEAPLVHSISYGEYGGSYDNATVQRFSYELMKLGVRGITVMLASGDNGVGCSFRFGCSFHHGSDLAQEFDFPSSPYLTSVGATQLEASGEESGATLSSGGFSRDYPRAEFAPWQADAVDAYLAKLGKDAAQPKESFFAGGRGYPDVSAIGNNVQVVIGGKVASVAGTSCSSPMFAGIVALMNAELLAEGKPPMGWLNPWLYAHTDMFTDVTAGSNPYGCCDGFEAAEGWDPVTGLGTPVFSKMLEYALAMK